MEKYNGSAQRSRYSFATLIANSWFKKLDELVEDGVDIEELKQDIDNKNLIGEYCGHPAHKHLIIYPEERVIFYTIVDNTSEDSCMLPEYCVEIFRKYKLESVTFESLGVFSAYDDMKQSLKDSYLETSKESIKTGEEGSVLYFVKRTPDAQDERILSLAKLKTLEYRYYRKLREKLAGTMAQYQNSQKDQKKSGFKSLEESFKNVMSKFETEINQLNSSINDGETILDESEIETYLEIAKAATETIIADPEVLNNAREQYLDFLADVIKNTTGGEDRLVSMIFDKQSDIEYQRPAVE